MKNISQDFFNFRNEKWINNDDYINKILSELSSNKFISLIIFFINFQKIHKENILKRI